MNKQYEDIKNLAFTQIQQFKNIARGKVESCFRRNSDEENVSENSIPRKRIVKGGGLKGKKQKIERKGELIEKNRKKIEKVDESESESSGFGLSESENISEKSFSEEKLPKSSKNFSDTEFSHVTQEKIIDLIQDLSSTQAKSLKIIDSLYNLLSNDPEFKTKKIIIASKSENLLKDLIENKESLEVQEKKEKILKFLES